MTSQVAIYNLALGRIGSDDIVNATGERSNAAKRCNQFYDHAREVTLREFSWNFARKSVALAQIPIVSTSGTEIGYPFKYAQPADCLNAHVICPETGVRWWTRAPGGWFCSDRWMPRDCGYPRAEFLLMAGEAATVFLTDLEDAYLIYTANIADTSRFDTTFVDALAWRLAAEIAVPMLGTTSGVRVGQAMSQAYQEAKGNAIAASLNERQPGPRPDPPAIAARG